MNRIAITGSSGYLGGKLVEHFRQTDARIWGLDILAPDVTSGENPDEFHQLDICDERLSALLGEFQPDTIIHAAFAFKPMRDEAKMKRINIDGTRNLLAAASALQPQRLLVVSSATAYGAWPDNPVPMDESSPLRARTEFRYAADKTAVEGMLLDFAERNPKIAVSSIRPAVIGGPNLNNYLSRFIFGMPFLVMLDGEDGALQFVHEQDVVMAIETILKANGRGAFNCGPSDWTTVTQIAELTKRRTIKWPFWLARLLHGFAWKIRFPIHESPASFLYFARYPWVVSSKRLREELGYEFKYSCKETLQEILKQSS